MARSGRGAPSRRALLLGLSVTAALAPVAAAQGPEPGGRPKPPTGSLGQGSPRPKVRKDIATLEPGASDIKAYARAVARFHELPGSDPRNWRNLARTAQDAPRGGWFFLPWVRAAVLNMEALVREASGDASFAMPYWSPQSSPRLPRAVSGPGEALDPYRWSDPDPSLRAGLPRRDATAGSFVPLEIESRSALHRILAIDDFELFGGSRPRRERKLPIRAGAVEAELHNPLLAWVGGHMAGPLPSLDPLYWLHLAALDRVWSLWTQQGHPEPTLGEWTGHRFSDAFVDGRGQRIASPPVSDMLSTARLGYTYEAKGLPAVRAATRAPPRRAEARSTGTDRPANVTAGTRFAATVAIALKSPLASPVVAATREALATQARQRVVLRLTSVSAALPTRAYGVRVFLNAVPVPTPETPISDPAYVTTFALRPGENDGAAGATGHLAIDLTAAVARLAASGRPVKDKLNVQFVAVTFQGRERSPPEVKIQRVDVVVD